MNRLITSPSTTALLALTVALVGLADTATAHDDEKHPRAPEIDFDELVDYPRAEYPRGVRYKEVSRYGDSWFVDQQPANTVRVDGFYLDKHEVTVREFALFLSYAAGELHYHDDQPIDRVDDGYRPADGADDEPIRQVTWWAARDYCRWAGQRLPTESEWEFAARGVDRKTYPWGDEGTNCKRANYFTGRAFCNDGPVDVGSHPDGTTSRGTHDLAGNVAEWTADWYARYPDADETIDNPTGPEDGDYKVVRGGGYLDSGTFLRTPARRALPPNRHAEDVGFRCAISKDADFDKDDVIRGELELPDDTGREDHDRFPAPEAQTADVLAEGLDRPGSLVVFDETVYVIDDNRGELVEIDPDTGEASTALEREGLARIVAGADRLYATDDGSNEILEIVPGMPATTLASTDEAPGPLFVDDDRLIVGTDSTVLSVDRDAGETTTLVENLTHVVTVAASETTVFYAADGDGNLNDFELGAVPVDGGDTTVLMSSSDVGGRYAVPSLVYRAPSDRLYFLLQADGFPRHGYVCYEDLDDDSSNCFTHTPPNPAILARGSDTLYWSTSRNLVSMTPGDDETFGFPAKWTKIGGMAVTPDAVVWSDRHTGRIHSVQR